VNPAEAARSIAAHALSERYARHQLIPGWEQSRLAGASAVVFGVGALGNEVAKNLALAGVGRLVLCDPDVVQSSNLSRSVLFRPAAAESGGAPKVLAAAEALRALVPGIDVDTRISDLASGVGLGELYESGIVLGCLDSRQARLRLLGRCALVDAPLVDGGITAWGGELRFRLATAESCYGCSLSTHDRAVSDLPWSCADAAQATGEPVGASIASTALVAAWMTQVALRVLLGRPPEFRFLFVDGWTGRTEPLVVSRDPLCPFHEAFDATKTAEVAVGHQHTVADLLERLPTEVDPLTWVNFRLPGSCPHCGVVQETGVDLGAASRLCSACGGRLPLPFTRRLRAAEPDLPLHAVGVAPWEILAGLLPEGDIRWLRMKA